MKKIIRIILQLLNPDKFILGRVANSDKRIAITFDDGPHPVNTKKLLSVLKNGHVKATFFVSGSEVEKYPQLIDEIREEGHEVGNHSFSHKKISEIGFDAYRKGIEKTSLLIEESCRQKPDLFRPPYGEITSGLLRFILNNGLRYISWTVDSNDSYIKDKEKLIDFMRDKPIKDGDIILFHEDYATTIDAIPEIIADFKKRGFKPVTVSELKD